MAHDIKGASTILIDPNTHERVTITKYAQQHGVPEDLVHELAEEIRRTQSKEHRRDNPKRYTKPHDSSVFRFGINPIMGRRGHRRKPQE